MQDVSSCVCLQTFQFCRNHEALQAYGHAGLLESCNPLRVSSTDVLPQAKCSCSSIILYE